MSLTPNNPLKTLQLLQHFVPNGTYTIPNATVPENQVLARWRVKYLTNPQETNFLTPISVAQGTIQTKGRRTGGDVLGVNVSFDAVPTGSNDPANFQFNNMGIAGHTSGTSWNWDNDNFGSFNMNTASPSNLDSNNECDFVFNWYVFAGNPIFEFKDTYLNYLVNVPENIVITRIG